MAGSTALDAIAPAMPVVRSGLGRGRWRCIRKWLRNGGLEITEADVYSKYPSLNGSTGRAVQIHSVTGFNGHSPENLGWR